MITPVPDSNLQKQRYTNTLGIDLAKNVFQLHGVNKNDKAVLSQQLRREKLIEFMMKLPPCLIGMEACNSAQYWPGSLKRWDTQLN